jgi:hypothetical protein
MRRVVIAALAAAMTGTPAAAAKERSCEPVRNPYQDSRYEGVDLTKIRTVRASCKAARRVARRAHHKALGLPLPADGIHRFTWRSAATYARAPAASAGGSDPRHHTGVRTGPFALSAL